MAPMPDDSSDDPVDAPTEGVASTSDEPPTGDPVKEPEGRNPEEAFSSSRAAEEEPPTSTADALSGAGEPSTAGGGGGLEAERDEYLAHLQRVKAEFDNYRKRVERERVEMIERAAERVVRELLPVVDACQAAVAQGDESVGVVLGQLMEILHKEGLEEVDPLGQPFDPNEHEAVLREDEGAEPETILEVMRKGFSYRERVLRPAMVKVQA